MISGEIELPDVNSSEITDPVIREFLMLLEFPPENQVVSEGELTIEEQDNQRPPRDVVLRVINLLKKV